MAGRILGPWNPPRDAAGAIDFDATLEFYENGTLTPKVVYSDYGLTTSAGVTATVGVNGLFPTAWTADRVRVIWRNGLGDQVLLVDDVGPSDFAGDNDFVRSFGADGRAQIRAESGVIQWESGNASPSDVGGSARIGGWNGTPLDDLEIDASGAVTAKGDWTFEQTVSFPNEAVFNGYQVGMVLLAHGEWGGAGTVQPSFSLPTAYNMFRLVIFDLGGAITSAFKLQASANDGASYETASLYDNFHWRPGYAGAFSTTSGYLLRVINGSGSFLSVPNYVDLTLQREVSGNHMKVTGRMGNYGSGAALMAETFLSTNQQYAGVTNRVQLADSGAVAITGKYALFAYPGIGNV